MSEDYRALQHTIFTEHVMPCRAYLVTSTKINLMPPEGKITWDLFFKNCPRGPRPVFICKKRRSSLREEDKPRPKLWTNHRYKINLRLGQIIVGSTNDSRNLVREDFVCRAAWLSNVCWLLPCHCIASVKLHQERRTTGVKHSMRIPPPEFCMTSYPYSRMSARPAKKVIQRCVILTHSVSVNYTLWFQCNVCFGNLIWTFTHSSAWNK